MREFAGILFGVVTIPFFLYVYVPLLGWLAPQATSMSSVAIVLGIAGFVLLLWTLVVSVTILLLLRIIAVLFRRLL